MSRRRQNHFGSASEFLRPPRENGLLQLPRRSGSRQKARSKGHRPVVCLVLTSRALTCHRSGKKIPKKSGQNAWYYRFNFGVSDCPNSPKRSTATKIYENSSSLVYSKSCSLTSAYHNCGYADFRGGGNGFRCSESIRRVVIREVEGQS